MKGGFIVTSPQENSAVSRSRNTVHAAPPSLNGFTTVKVRIIKKPLAISIPHCPNEVSRRYPRHDPTQFRLDADRAKFYIDHSILSVRATHHAK